MERDILHVLATDGPLHVMEIAAQIDGHPITVDQTCVRLHNDGHISMIGGGRFHLTDFGREHLSENPKQRREYEETA